MSGIAIGIGVGVGIEIRTGTYQGDGDRDRIWIWMEFVVVIGARIARDSGASGCNNDLLALRARACVGEEHWARL